MTMEEYISLLIRCIEQLQPQLVIHRLTGDGPKDLLIAPLWSTRKRLALNRIHTRIQTAQKVPVEQILSSTH